MPVYLKAQVPDYVPTDGLVGWWPFTGNANDESGNGNDGVVNGAMLTEDRYGIVNAAYVFDGVDDLIKVEDDQDELDLVGNFTLSCWIRIENLDEAGHHLIMKHYGNIDNMGSYGLVLSQSSSEPDSYYVTFQATPNWSPASYPSDTYAFQLQEWYHFAVSYDHILESLNYYINGDLFEMVQVNFDIVDTDIDVLFGSTFMNDSTSMAYYFHGSMDDIGIWDRALTPEEIGSLYAAQSVHIAEENGSVNFLNLHPNPNRGDQLFLSLSAIDENVLTVTVDIHDLSGKRMMSRTIPTQGGYLNIVMDLEDEIAAGMYLVNITAGDKLYTERLVVQP
jgi:hypothetical protein